MVQNVQKFKQKMLSLNVKDCVNTKYCNKHVFDFGFKSYCDHKVTSITN
jgi:hypothetical protein